MVNGAYHECYRSLRRTIPSERLISDDLRTLAYGTDASFYRLIPKLVVKVETEEEVSAVLTDARKFNLPLTFRAAGTSLSGQAITDSLLVVLGTGWKGYAIQDAGKRIALRPGVIGAHANIYLAPFGKKIGPDPASINAAMIGGIAANNASGMCCGTAQNSYRTLASMRVILSDGTLLDTGDAKSRTAFLRSHASLVDGLRRLSDRVKADASLSARIHAKYKMKNTTGYSLNALVDFDDPLEILQHLMIGSEGTLGFIAEVTYNTVDELPDKASSLMVFPDIATACTAVTRLKATPVDAVELMDRASLRSVEGKIGMPAYLPSLGPGVAALLVETRAAGRERLAANIEAISTALADLPNVRPLAFTSDPTEFKTLWDIRKGLFPSVGAMRRTGTTVIIEDVAFPVQRLAEATVDLQRMLERHGYHEAIIFGHALEGNLHFVFTQDFNAPAEVIRYRDFMNAVAALVVEKYDGSLKAEHGTGRNMAPFVVKEWGETAYGLMKELKALFDPGNLLNPGVILNDDHEAHLKNLKPLPAADAIVDKCIECGFCENHCPSRDLTLSPRQRIVIYREIARLGAGGDEGTRLNALRSGFAYDGMDTCATDGLCATACPVGIDTGKLIKSLRVSQTTSFTNSTASFLARHMRTVTGTMRGVLNLLDRCRSITGARLFGRIAFLARAVSGSRLPLWNPEMPRGAARIQAQAGRPRSLGQKVVYFPSCINRTMGVSHEYDESDSVTSVAERLLRKAGFAIVFPENLEDLCCGMAFDSKGYRRQGAEKARQLGEALMKASDGGTIPIFVDMSPCLSRMKETLPAELRLYEPVEFILTYLVDRLEFSPLDETIALHTPCSAIKMGLEGQFKSLAGKCAKEVVIPMGIECCGWAGDRGFTVPELNASALASLRESIPNRCTAGYSTSRTCEIGLSLHSGIRYSSIVNLVDRCTKPKEPMHSSGDLGAE